MANFFKDNDDLQYYFDKGVDWDSLVRITEREFADAEGDGFSTTEEAVDFYRDIIVSRLNDLLGESLKTIFDLAALYDEIGIAAKAREILLAERGVLVIAAGGNTLRMAPPLTITAAPTSPQTRFIRLKILAYQ